MTVGRSIVLVIVSVLVLASIGLGKAEYSKKEGKPCTYCHPAGKFKELSEAGKYYQQHRTLEGYQCGQTHQKMS